MGNTWRKCMVPTCNKILPDKTWNDRYIDNKEGDPCKCHFKDFYALYETISLKENHECYSS
jgi:hypothetical protein